MSSAKVCGVLLPTGSHANVCRKTNVRGEVCGICEKCAACACVCVMSSVECVGYFYQLVPKPVNLVEKPYFAGQPRRPHAGQYSEGNVQHHPPQAQGSARPKPAREQGLLGHYHESSHMNSYKGERVRKHPASHTRGQAHQQQHPRHPIHPRAHIGLLHT